MFSSVVLYTRKMPRRYRSRRSPVRRRRLRGRGFFGNIWNGIKRVATGAHDFIKSNRLVSRGLALTPYKGAAAAAGALGYGRRKRRSHRRQRGRGSNIANLKKVYRLFANSSRVGAGRKLRSPRSRMLGGRRKRRVVHRRRRSMRGRGVMDLLRRGHALIKKHKVASRLLSHFGHKKLSSAASALGYGRRRRRVRRSTRRRGIRGRGLFSRPHQGFVSYL
jgi:hypothetical protein